MEGWNVKEFGTMKMIMNTKIAAMMKPAPLTVRNNYELSQLQFCPISLICVWEKNLPIL